MGGTIPGPHNEKKEAAKSGGLVDAQAVHGLLKLCRDTRERRIQLRAEAVHNRNDGDGNAGGNQAVFNGCGSRLILHEPNNKLRHSGALGVALLAQAATYQLPVVGT
jgi:hypothetical protein